MKKQKDNLFLILLAGAILVIGAAGLLLMQKPKTSKIEDVQTQKLETQGSSDETVAIEQDLKNTDFSALDQELKEIESQL